jgi:hypothetical protein
MMARGNLYTNEEEGYIEPPKHEEPKKEEIDLTEEQNEDICSRLWTLW